MHDLSTTLAAVATAPGRGGVGCVRLSGPNAARIAARLFRPRKGRPPKDPTAPRFVTFLDASGVEIDHGYVVEFPAGASFTGEPTTELWTHGSPPVLEALVSGAQAAGAVLAGPGEFTYRALRNGRIDLARAEAIRDLVAARTAYQARVAFSQLRGAAARKLAPLTDKLLELIARGEAAIEFADEAETHMAPGGLAAGVEAALAEARGLAADARRGRVVREGARIALVGATSVGKSSLFNRLLGSERAIVSPTPGTTRDTIEETTAFGGVPALLVDTAGLRDPRTAIEAEGVRRARAAAEEADLTLFVLDASRTTSDEERGFLGPRVPGEPALIVVANKWDITASREPPFAGAIPVSAATGEGVPRLRAAIERALTGSAVTEDPVITDLRQTRALDEAVAALERAASVAALGDEVVVEDLRDALRWLGSITGEVGNEDLYDRIFSTFCIGK